MHNPTFTQAVQLADQNGLHLAISTPAFEFWYVLHFEFTTRPFDNGANLKEYLKRHIPNYYEAMDVFDYLINSTKTAIKNAKKINEIKDNRFSNPSTYVHLVVEDMIEMSPSGREHFK